MNSTKLLTIHPQTLQFPFELYKQISCNMQLTNNSNNHVAFKVKITNPKKYCVWPNMGIVMPYSTLDVSVTMQAQRKAPADMQCKDKFLIQSVITAPGITFEDINSDMFKKGSGNIVEWKLKVSYISPPQSPPIAQEGLNEGDLLSIDPQELQFPFELNKLISCGLQLTNNTGFNVAFKVYTTNPKKFCIWPSYGIVMPNSIHDLIVELEPQKEAPINMECKDGFLIQSVITTITNTYHVNSDTFNKEFGKDVHECILKVSYVSPPQPPSAAQESSDEGVTISDSGNSRPDSTKNPGILRFSDLSPPQPLLAAQEILEEDLTVSDNKNLRPGSLIIPRHSFSYVSPPQPPSTAQQRSNEGELLSVQPQEFQTCFKLNKEMFCTMKLTNNSDSYVAFKVKTTNAEKYCVRPYIGIVTPLSTRYLLVMIQAQEELSNKECKDMILLRSVITGPETTSDNINSDMFNNEYGNVVNERKLKIRYVLPSQTLSAALHRMDLIKDPRSDDVELKYDPSQMIERDSAIQ